MTGHAIDLALTRRGLLVGAAALTTAGCCRAFASDIDVVVIGAGAAGIGAAQMLASLGRNCVVIEADRRVGGRAYTDTRSFGVPFDIGCAWIHAAHSNPFYGFAIEHGYHVKYHDLSLDEIYYRNKRQPDAFVANEHKAEFMIGAAIDATAKEKRKHALPASDVLPTRAPPMDAAATYLGPMDAGVDLDAESIYDHEAESEAEYDPNYLVKEGFGTVVAKVAQGVRVRTSVPATAIRYDGKGVSVETPHGTINAKAAIVTVSTGVLRKGAIAFTPALPAATQEAIHALPMGLLTKIPMLIPNHGFYGVQPFANVLNEDPNRDDDFYFLAWPWNSDLLVGFVGGRYAWELSKRPDAEIIETAKQRLAEMFGSSIAAKVRKALVTPWANNPLTLGAYSSELPDRHGARETLAQPVADRLYFAGEAVATGGLFATCGGAYLSGEAAARCVDKKLG